MSKVPYYKVSPCPNCGSKRTGRYVTKSTFDLVKKDSEIIRDYLAHGQLVKVGRRGRNNAFCSDCGNTWTEYIKLTFISEDEYQKELLERGIEITISENGTEQKPSVGIIGKILAGLTGHRF